MVLFLAKHNTARLSIIGDLKKLMVESKEANQRHTENTEELRLSCLCLENDLEFANRSLAQLHSTMQLLASQTDRSNNNIRNCSILRHLGSRSSIFPDDSRLTPPPWYA